MKPGILAEKQYLAALLRDMEFELPRIQEREIETVFFGGGTPSLFSARGIETILAFLGRNMKLSAEAEITLEANPGAAEAERFRAYRETGVNRLSIGVQSFDDSSLLKLGRIHNAAEASAAIAMAKKTGFTNINIDLMHGLPGQTMTMALEDLKQAVHHQPMHLSWYQLTIEPNTVFYSQAPELPGDELRWEIQEQGRVLLESVGYVQYEVSAWAREDMVCRHNMNYWQFGDYLGFGAGAHGKLSSSDATQITRYQRHRIPQTYMDMAGTPTVVTGENILQREDIILEFMMNALRLRSGFSEGLFKARTGLKLEDVQVPLDMALDSQLISWEGEHIRPTERGLNYLNDLLAIFLPEAKHTG